MSIRITARLAGGIRRVGVHHPSEPTIWPDAFFEEDELATLRAEPALIVEPLDEEFVSPGERRHLSLLGGDKSSKDISETAAERTAAESEGVENTGSDGESEIPELPPVTRLLDFLSEISDRGVIVAMQQRDTRRTAAPVYVDRLAYLDELRELEAGR